MALPSGTQPRFEQVIPEPNFFLWVRTDGGAAYFTDFQRLTQGHSVKTSWDDWRAVRVLAGRHHLSWPCGLVCSLEELLREERAASRVGWLRVQRLSSVTALYRPLLEYLPPEPEGVGGFQLLWEVQERYGIHASALASLIRHYGAPPELLCRRLLDLVLALGHAYYMTVEDVRGLLHWQWHSPHRRTAARWPTPFAAIQAGDLHQVEATLYPHPPSGSWR